MAQSKDGLRPSCKECDKAWRAEAIELRQKYRRDYRARFPEKVAALNSAWMKRNAKAQAKKKKAYQQANLPAYRARNVKRRAAKLQAVTIWANEKKIKAFYADAARLTEETGVKHSVDHVVPLQSPIVCGLHWEGNLCVLPLIDNIAKSNRTWPDCP